MAFILFPTLKKWIKCKREHWNAFFAWPNMNNIWSKVKLLLTILCKWREVFNTDLYILLFYKYAFVFQSSHSSDNALVLKPSHPTEPSSANIYDKVNAVHATSPLFSLKLSTYQKDLYILFVMYSTYILVTALVLKLSHPTVPSSANIYNKVKAFQTPSPNSLSN